MGSREFFHSLIVKFLGREGNIHELDTLEEMLKSNQNFLFFQETVRTSYLINLSINQFDTESAKKSIGDKIALAQRKRRKKRFQRGSSVLAIICIICCVSFFVRDESITERNIPLVEIGSNKAILTLNNGDEVVLEKNRQYQNNSLVSNGESIIYSKNTHNEVNGGVSDYNFLKIPRGGQFFMELEDGTKVWLNSESKIKYPVSFIQGETRIVELMYGEAYFEVSPSTLHKGAKFLVKTHNQDVMVYGTKFNIRAYNNERFIKTTLVEGEIAVETKGQSEILKPNDQSVVSDLKGLMHIQQVDAWNKISWVKNQLIFDEDSLEDIVTELSRWYNVDFVFESVEKKKFMFTGVLERTRDINEVLGLIEATSANEDLSFEITDGMIIIK